MRVTACSISVRLMELRLFEAENARSFVPEDIGFPIRS